MKDFGDYLIEEKEKLRRKLDAIDVLLEDYELVDAEEPKKPKGKVGRPKAVTPGAYDREAVSRERLREAFERSSAARRGKAGTRCCKACGKSGHRSDSQLCPQFSGSEESNVVTRGDEGLLADDDDEPVVTRERVQELKDEGLTSLQVAAKLKCRLAVVNSFW